jgi:hypothetical protein
LVLGDPRIIHGINLLGDGLVIVGDGDILIRRLLGAIVGDEDILIRRLLGAGDEALKMGGKNGR